MTGCNFSDISKTPSGKQRLRESYFPSEKAEITGPIPQHQIFLLSTYSRNFEEMLQKRKSIEQIQLDRQNILLASDEQIPTQKRLPATLPASICLLAHSYHNPGISVLGIDRAWRLPALYFPNMLPSAFRSTGKN